MRAVQILTALTIATASSVALAQPLPVPPETYDRSYERPYDHYDREAAARERYSRGDVHGRWITLAHQAETLDGKHDINVGGRGGRIGVLRIEADRGMPLIKRIAVEYTNGAREVVRLDEPLRFGHGQLIDLEGNRGVSRIVVIADPRYYGMYSIYGT